jgi:hypothetical protein
VELRQHRRSFYHDWLHKEHAKKNKDDNDQKYVAKKLEALGPQPTLRFAAQLRHLDRAVIASRYEAKIGLVFAPQIEHNRAFFDALARTAVAVEQAIFCFTLRVCQRLSHL